MAKCQTQGCTIFTTQKKYVQKYKKYRNEFRRLICLFHFICQFVAPETWVQIVNNKTYQVKLKLENNVKIVFLEFSIEVFLRLLVTWKIDGLNSNSCKLAKTNVVQKSGNLQYNTLAHWVAGTNDSSSKHLMFQALFFS